VCVCVLYIMIILFIYVYMQVSICKDYEGFEQLLEQVRRDF